MRTGIILGACLLLMLGACQRESAPPVATAPVAVQAPAVAPVAAPPVDHAALCRSAGGGWTPDRQYCEMTSAMCPRFGSWVNGSGCKTSAVEADCKAAGQQFDASAGCLLRYIPADAMRPADFSKE